jgi:uncharacterized hydrophobic protein (TIGR00271 family)
MVHLRVIAPPALAEVAHATVLSHPSALNVVRLIGATERPAGDLILCDVAREDASVLVSELRDLGLEREGSIALEPISSLISAAADRAEEAAAGSPADAVVWEQVESQTSESAELSFSFLSFMVLATLIAALGIVQDSQILIIGAMVVGPEFGPLAGLCVALVQHRRELAWRSFRALAIGFPVAIAAALGLTAILRATSSAPPDLSAASHPATLFISHPDEYSVLVALLAGVAGVLSLSTAKSGALIGVLISVTTIPAAANVGVASAYGDWSEFGGALAQLAVNLSALVAAGFVTLALQRAFYRRRRGRLRLSRGRLSSKPLPTHAVAA